jgi:hypothetical protein
MRANLHISDADFLCQPLKSIGIAPAGGTIVVVVVVVVIAPAARGTIVIAASVIVASVIAPAGGTITIVSVIALAGGTITIVAPTSALIVAAGLIVAFAGSIRIAIAGAGTISCPRAAATAVRIIVVTGTVIDRLIRVVSGPSRRFGTTAVGVVGGQRFGTATVGVPAAAGAIGVLVTRTVGIPVARAVGTPVTRAVGVCVTGTVAILVVGHGATRLLSNLGGWVAYL